jgi:hypothetical protein
MGQTKHRGGSMNNMKRQEVGIRVALAILVSIVSLSLGVVGATGAGLVAVGEKPAVESISRSRGGGSAS